jgi:tetratricopeptide (TPR) repeat protein
VVLTTAYAALAWQAEQHYQEANRMRQLGGFTSMLAEAKAAAMTDRTSGEYRIRLGNIHRERFRSEGSEEDYRTALRQYAAAAKLMPTSSVPWTLRGGVLFTRRDWKGAAAAYRTALKNDPNLTDALLHLGESLREMGDEANARRMFLRIVEMKEGPWGRYPAMPELVDINVGRAYLYLGEFARIEGNTLDSNQRFAQARLVVQQGLAHERGLWSRLRKVGLEVSAPLQEEWEALRNQINDASRGMK